MRWIELHRAPLWQTSAMPSYGPRGMEPTEGPTVRKTKRLAAVALALGGALAGSITSASATTGAQLAACTSANYNAHLVWFNFTKTDGTTFCVGGGTGTVS